MAIFPNDTFYAGEILTAAECNKFPRGIVAYDEVTATDNTITAEEVQITGSSFTATLSRFYRVTYFEPNLLGSVAGTFQLRLRLTNLTGTLQQVSNVTMVTVGNAGAGICSTVVSSIGGTQNFVATVQASAGTGTATRSATLKAWLLVEDIGEVA
jgi:hypothetical protein